MEIECARCDGYIEALLRRIAQLEETVGRLEEENRELTDILDAVDVSLERNMKLIRTVL